MTRVAVAACALLAFALPSCIAPPALLEAETRPFADARNEMLPGTELVELRVDDETVLRGVFVPADADRSAPVVLHLLESSGSVAERYASVDALTRELADLGFASLVLDYAGVGVSSGERSCTNLERDARAMWDEAVRRAGGDPRRVVVRATSIGTLATGTLLAHGVRPGAVVLLLPVLADTVVERFAREFHGLLGLWTAKALFRDVVDVDLVDVLRRADVPIFALSSPDETFVDADERARLRAAVESNGGTWRELPGGHLLLTCASKELFVDEARFLAGRAAPRAEERANELLGALPPDVASRFEPGTDARARLVRVMSCVHPARGATAAALALAETEPFDAWRLARHFPRPAPRRPTFDELTALCDLRDPDGDLPIDLVDELCLQLNALDRSGVLVWEWNADQIVTASNTDGGRSETTYRMPIAAGVTVSTTLSGRDVWRRMPRSERLEDTRRRFVRVLMRVMGLAERVRRDAEGGIGLEQHAKDGWSPLDLTTTTGGSARVTTTGRVR